MARFDVYQNPHGSGYLLDIQADLLTGLNTRTVVPLMPKLHAPQPAQILNPEFVISGEVHVMVTQFMAAVPTTILANPVVNLRTEHERIVAAIDFLMQGF
ncbi:CcdB family protein [Desulfurispira natronophila]|uniref:Toxin CcdB n=1 Tax=Desulfurispira natronophila TaxID=682562 RepID=A0A7W7Y596_9BACT|nr:CcdB family protein [Desulfurispira natronophila]MBB5022252.1 toxin CcdB [Desulfurispira natronophila]